jgi:Icc protein
VTPTTLLAQISDPHIRLEGPGDENSGPALAAAVARVLALPQAPDAVIVTGDIANSGDRREHELASELLAPLPMPVHLVAGNHDLFAEPLRYVAHVGALRLVTCDTSIAGRDDGQLDVGWLAEQLDDDRETPTIVAMHHPPIIVGLPWLDEIGLPAADRAALSELLARSPQVKRVVAGHVHRTIADTLGGCGVVTCASTNIACALNFAPGGMELVREPPSILVHALIGDALVTHAQPI